MSRPASKWVRPVLGLLVTIFFIWLLLRHIDLDEVAVILSRFSFSSLAIALAFLAVGYTIRIVRWWWMLRVLDPQIPLQSCVGPFLASIAVNKLVPRPRHAFAWVAVCRTVAGSIDLAGFLFYRFVRCFPRAGAVNLCSPDDVDNRRRTGSGVRYSVVSSAIRTARPLDCSQAGIDET